MSHHLRALPLVALCLLASPASAQVPAAVTAVRTVAVTGYAEAKLAPDQALLYLNVQTEDKQLAAGKDEQDKKMKLLMKILADNGVPAEKVRTQYANINPQYDYVQNGKPKFRNYQLSNRVEIVIEDLAKTGPIVDKLVEANFDRVENVQFGLRDENKRREELLTAAITNAKGKAGSMAAAVGMKVGKAVSVTESGASNPQPIMMTKAFAARAPMMADQAAESSMPSYSPTGLIEINQTVNVSFELE